MGSIAFHHVRSTWPLWVPALALPVGLAAGGAAGAVIAFTLAFLVLGPVYLLRQRSLRRSGRISPREPATPAQKARFLKGFALFNLVAALVLLAAAAERGDWLPGDRWNAFLAVLAVWSAGSAPYLWATAVLLETGQRSRRAWILVGTVDLLLGFGFLGAAVANQGSAWIGDGRWTLGLAALGAVWLAAGTGCLVQLRAPGR